MQNWQVYTENFMYKNSLPKLNKYKNNSKNFYLFNLKHLENIRIIKGKIILGLR